MDEPGLKAKFKFTLTRHRSFPSTFFNTELEESVPDATGEWFTDFFKTTVDMSTYLVAFVVSDFKKIETTSALGVKIEVAAKPQSIDNGEGDFSLAEAALYIDYFARYFNLEYPLNKSSLSFFNLRRRCNIVYLRYFFFLFLSSNRDSGFCRRRYLFSLFCLT